MVKVVPLKIDNEKGGTNLSSTTRVDMIMEMLKKNNKEYDEDFFETLMTDHYSELYSLYNILKRSEILDNCKFKYPELVADELTFPISLASKHVKKVKSYLESKKFVVKYLRTDEFKVKIGTNSGGISVRFEKV